MVGGVLDIAEQIPVAGAAIGEGRDIGAGILGEYKGSQAREVIITAEEYEQLREQMELDQAEDSQGTGDEEEDSDGPAYISEGQREYIVVDSDEE